MKCSAIDYHDAIWHFDFFFRNFYLLKRQQAFNLDGGTEGSFIIQQAVARVA
jgi:hypothetical protein